MTHVPKKGRSTGERKKSNCKQCENPKLKKRHDDTCVKSKVYLAKKGAAVLKASKSGRESVSKKRALALQPQKQLGTKKIQYGQEQTVVEINTDDSEDCE